MKICLAFNRSDLSALQLPVIVENYSRVKDNGSVRRRYLKEFSEKERKIISAYYNIIYKWYLVTGYPETYVFRKVKTIDLLRRATDFFASI